MEQETALELLKTGATFVLDNFSKGSEFGIDMKSFTVGEKFKGARSGFFHFFKPGELLARKWDAKDEDIKIATEDEVDRFQANLIGDLDKFLAPYPRSEYQKWSGLTDYIDEQVVKRLNPSNGRIDAVTQMIPQEFVSSTSSRAAVENLPDLAVEPSAAINFIKIPLKSFPEGSVPSDITQHSIDSSFALEEVLKQISTAQLLGELQFSFVCFVVGHVYDGFEQWKTLMRLLCTSDKVIADYPKLFNDFIRILHFQLKEVPEDLFVDIVERSNFLVAYLSIFFSNLSSSQRLDESIKRRGERFRENLTKKFKWDFDMEPEDEAPVIVDAYK